MKRFSRRSKDELICGSGKGKKRRVNDGRKSVSTCVGREDQSDGYNGEEITNINGLEGNSDHRRLSEEEGSVENRNVETLNNIEVDNQTVECVGEREEAQLDERNVNAQYLLAGLLTCGSLRMGGVMYGVVRKLLRHKDCDLCGKEVGGLNLPGLTYIKTKAKPMLKKWYARHDVMNVEVDQSKAGAKTGVDKHQSTTTAPLVIVSPIEWARRDFYTPSLRNLIWGDKEVSEARIDCMFSSIETAPIVTNRGLELSEIRMEGIDGLGKHVKVGSCVQLKVVRNDIIDNILKRVRFEDLTFEESDGKLTSVITSTVIRTEYVGEDCRGHKVVRGRSCQEHNGGKRKAGDVNIYVACDARDVFLVNRYNAEENEHRLFLHVCIGSGRDCDMNIVPVDNCYCLDEDECEEQYVPSSGVLEDGMKYFVYRFLLYTDGFNAHRSKAGSMDGMYIVPLGMGTRRRTESGCLHKICLAPPGVAATDVMKIITEDIVEGMTKGIDVVENGERCKMFLDPVCYVGDSPALAHATGCKGHSSDTPCHVCTFKRDKGGKVEIAISSAVTSSTCSRKRTFKKVDDISRSCTSVEGRQIGMSNSRGPLMDMARAIRRIGKIHKTSKGREVVSNCFDPFLSSVISPDHVFLGLIGNLLEALLKLLKPKEREIFQIQCIEVLSKSGMYDMKSILNVNLQLLKTTISESFAILFICPVVLRRMKITAYVDIDEEDGFGERRKPLRTIGKLLLRLGRIIVLAQRNPDPSVDSGKDLEAFNNGKGRVRLSLLVNMSRDYCKLIESLAGESLESARILDKPNLHRFMELFAHTLPLFGSLKYIEELILEKAHQSAKKAIDMSNMKNEQVQAMNDFLHDDLVARLKSFVIEYGEYGITTGDQRSRKIIEASCGLLHVTAEEAEEVMRSLFNREVLDVIELLGKDICNRDALMEWHVEETEFHYSGEHERIMTRADVHMKRSIEHLSRTENWKEDVWCKQGSSAVLKKPKGERKCFERHCKVVPFDVVEVCCEPIIESEGTIYRRSNLSGERVFIRVLGFLRTKQNGKLFGYCVGRRMKKYVPDECRDEMEITEQAEQGSNREDDNDDDTDTYYDDENLIVIVEMCHAVRKAFVAHACWIDGSCRTGNREIVHGAAGSLAMKYVVCGRREGYPPRRG